MFNKLLANYASNMVNEADFNPLSIEVQNMLISDCKQSARQALKFIIFHCHRISFE